MWKLPFSNHCGFFPSDPFTASFLNHATDDSVVVTVVDDVVSVAIVVVVDCRTSLTFLSLFLCFCCFCCLMEDATFGYGRLNDECEKYTVALIKVMGLLTTYEQYSP